jgi:hypothetical protein
MMRILLTLACLLGALSPLLLTTPPAMACSVGVDFDRIAESDIIVEGRLTGWSKLPKPSPGIGLENYVPVLVQIDVAMMHKGDSTGEFVDTASLLVTDSGEDWAGHATCGAFVDDPTGLYVIFGLRLHDDGSYHSSTILSFFEGESPSGQAYEDAVRFVSPTPTPTAAATPTPPATSVPQQPSALPATGRGEQDGEAAGSTTVLTLAGLALAAVALSWGRLRA